MSRTTKIADPSATSIFFPGLPLSSIKSIPNDFAQNSLWQVNERITAVRMGTSTVCSRGSWPVTSLWPFYKPEPSHRERERDLPHCSHYSAQERYACVSVCVCTSFSPSPSSNLTSLPSFPFSFTPSQLCSLTHSEPGRKSWQSCSPLRNSRPQVNPRGRPAGRHFASDWRGLQRSHGDGSPGHL